jgi:recombination protein RecA
MTIEKISLTQAMNRLKKAYGNASIFKGSENISVKVDTLSSGCLAVDQVLRVGGLPIGRLIEVSGNEGSGKTIFCASVIAEWQSQGKKCAFIDAEHTADKAWFEKIGVNWEDLIFARPDNLEEALDIIHTLASTGEVHLICWDSVPALPSASEEKSEAGAVQVAAISKVLTPALRKLTPVFAKNQCTGIFINQIRNKIGVLYGSPDETPGGKALKFGCSLRLHTGKVGSSEIKDPITKETIGHRVRVRSLKNKLSNAQGVVTEFTLFYNSGIDKISDAVDTANLLGNLIVQRPNNKTYIFQDQKFNGRDNFVTALRQDKKLFQSLIDTLRHKLFVEGVTIQAGATTDLPDTEDDSEDDEGTED